MKTYCTQNNGDCTTCSLKNYGRDCRNQEISSEYCVTCGSLADDCRCGDFVSDVPAAPHIVVAAMAHHLVELTAYLEPGSMDMFGEIVDAASVKRQIDELMQRITKALNQI